MRPDNAPAVGESFGSGTRSHSSSSVNDLDSVASPPSPCFFCTQWFVACANLLLRSTPSNSSPAHNATAASCTYTLRSSAANTMTRRWNLKSPPTSIGRSTYRCSTQGDSPPRSAARSRSASNLSSAESARTNKMSSPLLLSERFSTHAPPEVPNHAGRDGPSSVSLSSSSESMTCVSGTAAGAAASDPASFACLATSLARSAFRVRAVLR